MTPSDLADVNVLVALSDPAHQFHSAAQEWLAGTTSFATTPITETGMSRILMTRTPASEPLSAAEALRMLRSIRAHPKWVFLPDGTSLADARALTNHLKGRQQVTDTHLLNLAISAGARLTTFDENVAASLTPSARRHLNVLSKE